MTIGAELTEQRWKVALHVRPGAALDISSYPTVLIEGRGWYALHNEGGTLRHGTQTSFILSPTTGGCE